MSQQLISMTEQLAMHPRLELLGTMTRRHFLQTTQLGLGSIALSSPARLP